MRIIGILGLILGAIIFVLGIRNDIRRIKKEKKEIHDRTVWQIKRLNSIFSFKKGIAELENKN